MKPRIVLAAWGWDCGWRYEVWHCIGMGEIGMGGTPSEAYRHWRDKC